MSLAVISCVDPNKSTIYSVRVRTHQTNLVNGSNKLLYIYCVDNLLLQHRQIMVPYFAISNQIYYYIKWYKLQSNYFYHHKLSRLNDITGNLVFQKNLRRLLHYCCPVARSIGWARSIRQRHHPHHHPIDTLVVIPHGDVVLLWRLIPKFITDIFNCIIFNFTLY